MKVYGVLESKVFYIDEKDEDEFIRRYIGKWSITRLQKLPFKGKNILRMELTRGSQSDEYDDFLMY